MSYNPFRTQERIFKRLHEDGLLLDRYPEEYDFYSHNLKSYDRAAGAIRWTMLPVRGTGPIIESSYTVNEICRKPVVRYTDIRGHEVNFEIMPAD